MLQFFKMLKPKTRWRLIGMVILLMAMVAWATYLVVHYSGLFSVGAVWGWVITFIIWSWFTVITNKIFLPPLKKTIMRWMEEDMKDLFTTQ